MNIETNKKIFPVIIASMTVLVLINVILASVILKKQSAVAELKSVLDSNKKAMEDLASGIPCAEAKDDRVQNALAESVQAELAKMKTSIDEMNKKTDEALENGMERMLSSINSLNSASAYVAAKNTKKDMSSDGAAAERALSLAEQAMENDNPDLAMIYMLNALNRNPSDMNCLQFYYDFIENKSKLEITDIDPFVDILDVSVYHVLPEDVSKIIEMRDNLLLKRESLLNSVAEELENDSSEQFVAIQKELQEGRLSPAQIVQNGKTDKELLDERIETIAALIADNDLSDPERIQYVNLLNETTTFKFISTTLESVENALSKAESFANRDSLTPEEILLARNQLQTANTYLSQIWTIDTSNFQKQLETAEKLQNRIANIDKELNVLASAPAKERIETIFKECSTIRYLEIDEKYTTRINQISVLLKEMTSLLAEVSDLETRKELESIIEKIPQYINDLSNDRFAEYQKWAVKVLNDAMNKYNNYTVFSDEKAMTLFNDGIKDINPSLLIYDVNSFYNGVYQIIYKELDGAKKQSDLQYRKATNQTKSLEDF